jgi:hypothetical protein
VAVQAFLLTGPWVLFLATIQGDFEQLPAYIPLPAAVVLVLIWLWSQIDAQARTGKDWLRLS